MTAQNEPELSPQDIADLASIGISPDGEEAPDNTILRIWKLLLSNVEKSLEDGVSMGMAARIVASWPKITFQETPRYYELYHELLVDARELLHALLDDNPSAIDVDPKEDMAENALLYKQLVIDWNIWLDDLETAWDAVHPESHLLMAAIADVRTFLFSRNGLAGHLEARGFELEAEEVVDALRKHRGEM